MIRSILVPLDGSPFSEHALPLAAELARRADARLHLARVHQPLPLPFTAGPGFVDEAEAFSRIEATLAEKDRAYLAGITHRPGRHASCRVTTEILSGDVAEVLCHRAAEADLVVMTTHGRGPLARFWLGSVADQLIRTLPVPVLLIRPEEAPPDLSREPAVKQLLLPLDGTPMAEQVIDPAVEIGMLLGASCTLVRVVRPVLAGSGLREGNSPEGAAHRPPDRLCELQKRLEGEARSYLESAACRLAARGIGVRTRVLVEEQPAPAILREARSGIDMIALATHGRGGIPRLLLGSVADKLIRGCTVPLLVCRPR
jgi:nucleotide-binding universal stress UspA family protein